MKKSHLIAGLFLLLTIIIGTYVYQETTFSTQSYDTNIKEYASNDKMTSKRSSITYNNVPLDKDLGKSAIGTRFQGCESISSLPQLECEALIDLYNHTNGHNWDNNENRIENNFPCSRFGVSCENGHVTGISLQNNNLDGKLTSKIGDFTELVTLNLGSNSLSHTIPSAIGNLSHLISLKLSSNSLEGAIPDTITELTQLKYLSLYSNYLEGNLPEELGLLSNLEILWAFSNSLSGIIPDDISNLYQLKQLNLGDNYFSGNIPQSLGNMQNLEVLILTNNLLEGSIPGSLGNSNTLKSIRLDHNNLSGYIPSQLGNITSLKKLILQHNDLSGPIPHSLGFLPNLESLGLIYNDLCGYFPESFMDFRGNDFEMSVGVNTNKLFTPSSSGYSQEMSDWLFSSGIYFFNQDSESCPETSDYDMQ